MNGRYFLDTNAIIGFLDGNSVLFEVLSSAKWIGTSVICCLEFLSYPDLSKTDEELFEKFVGRISVVDLLYSEEELIQEIRRIRKEKKVKLPDAIIVASASTYEATLVSNDKVFSNSDPIQVLTF